MKTITTTCSNCATRLTITDTGVSAKIPGRGRGSNRVAPYTASTQWYSNDNYLILWDAPCCTVGGEPYSDSYEVN